MLQLALGFTLAYIVLLVIAGFRAHSLALLSEAGHNVSDFFALLLSWVAAYFSERPPTSTKTYGWRRAGVLAAFVNAITLIVIAILIFYSALQRLSHPEPVHAGLMMWVAGAGVILNGAITLMLMRGGRDLNLRSVLIHEIGDTLSTAAVIIGGWAILATGHSWIDPALSIGISAMVLWSSISIVRESLNILLEGAPSSVELDVIESELRSLQGVLDVHDLHIWSIGSDTHALSSHITIADIPPSASNAILEELRQMLASRHHIHHTTIQFESADCDLAHGCILPVPHEHKHDASNLPASSPQPGNTR
ncbi:MAG TPA: cation diffusion facilitator family transporter [Candidatus Saccharimonadales bacterium]|nr:cation diffusion facilitator family transporter [Candidatus Saccharimonadales bacterium]